MAVPEVGLRRAGSPGGTTRRLLLLILALRAAACSGPEAPQDAVPPQEDLDLLGTAHDLAAPAEDMEILPPDLARSPFVLTSPALAEGGTFDKNNTCAGANLSPPLHWTMGPPQTRSYAVVLTDLTRGLIHWVIWDIPASTGALPTGVARVPLPPIPAGAKQAKSYNNTSYGYIGPCPGGVLHTYQFVLYALGVASLPNVSTDSTRAQVTAHIMAYRIATATLSGKSDARRP